MNRIGIKQGRLSPRPYPKLQAFPWSTWEKEFYHAAEIGYDFIELMFDEERYEENPLWSNEGRAKIKRLVSETGIYVGSVCADYFLPKPFYRRDGYTLHDHINVLKEVIKKSADVCAGIILLPVLENAGIRTEEEEKILTDVICDVLPTLKENGISIGLETELPIERCKKLMAGFDREYVGVYYDTGNYAACGHNMKDDVSELEDYIIAVHIKDRVKGGGSVFLGEGDVCFSEGIPYLVKSGYKGNFVMEAYYEDDYIGTASNDLNFIKKLILRGDNYERIG